MALRCGLIVALLAVNVAFSEAQNSTTPLLATPIPTTSSSSSSSSIAPPAATSTTTTGGQASSTTTSIAQIAPTSTTAAVPASPDTVKTPFYTYLKVRFNIEDCKEEKDDLLIAKFKSIFDNETFPSKNISYKVSRDSCQYNFTLTFGPDLKMFNISEVFEDRFKSEVDKLKLSNLEIEVDVPGVTLGDFIVTANECNKICCTAGGPITLRRTCKPYYKCRSYKLEKVEPKCTNVCKECSGMMCKISLLVLVFGLIMNWFLK